MKKKIYKVYVIQAFNAYVIEESKKWYIPDTIVEKREYVSNFDHYILAETKKEAIEKYKERYRWKDFDYIIDPWYEGVLSRYPQLNKKNPEFDCRVGATEVYPTFNTLKEELRADEFLEYCRQEMLPLEVVLCEKGED